MAKREAPRAEMGVSVGELVERYPLLYHVSDRQAWDSIRRHGLLSTTALLDLFEVQGPNRDRIERRHRPHSVAIAHPQHGRAVVRDQKPMNDSGLTRALQDGLTPLDWYLLLNRHIFFWVDRVRVDRLLAAKAYRTSQHTLITVRTDDLLRRYSAQTVLSPLNTGATKPMPHPRGLDCFLPLDRYPFADWHRRRRGKDTVVELSIQHGVPDVAEFVERVALVSAGESEIDIDV